MGYGDEIMGSGVARVVRARTGRRVAFGRGGKIKWHVNAHLIFRNNPNVAAPGEEHAKDLMWIPHYPGSRLYCQMPTGQNRWQFKAGMQEVGEFFFDERELAEVAAVPSGLILIEPNTKHQAPNKQWGYERYLETAGLLARAGYRVAQFVTGGMALPGVEQIRTRDFRGAAAVLQRARLYVGPEGGLHHAAAAVGTPAVVIFGGFISPAVTGYAQHVNIFTGTGLGCGVTTPCQHCRQAMARISSDMVAQAALGILEGPQCRIYSQGASA